MKTKTRTILASEEGEFSTVEISYSGGKFFRAVANGGERGSHQVNNRFPSYLEDPAEISKGEALAACAAMGVEEVEIPEEE